MSALSDIVHVARPFTAPLGAKSNIGVQYTAEHAAQTMGSGESEVQYAYHRFAVTHSLVNQPPYWSLELPYRRVGG